MLQTRNGPQETDYVMQRLQEMEVQMTALDLRLYGLLPSEEDSTIQHTRAVSGKRFSFNYCCHTCWLAEYTLKQRGWPRAGWRSIDGEWQFDAIGRVLSIGEWKSTFGSVFGHAIQLPSTRSETFEWDPAYCEMCGVTIQHLWVNYNYRCCFRCWNVIEDQLWRFLVEYVSEAPAQYIWSFLLEPGQHE